MATAETLGTHRAPVAARIAAAAALLALAWTLLVLLTGGVRVSLGAIVLSSRDPLRALVVFAATYGLSIALAAPGRRADAWRWLARELDRKSGVLAAAAAAAVLGVTLAYGARAASGADTFGYVSQAHLWLNGNLHIPQPAAAELPWPRAVDSISPLGYRPGQSPNSIVPTYSPGLPLIMAAFHSVAGVCGPYFVQPVFGSLFVLVTYGLAYRLSRSGLLAALASVFLACSPTLLFNLMTPMSDTVTAVLWTTSLLLLTWPGYAAAGMAGSAAALAVLVRPNLVPLAAAGILAAWLWPAETPPGRGRLGRVMVFAAAIVPAVVFVAVLNDRLYGSPALSGYGPASSLYAWRLFPGNVERYSRWLLQSQGVFVLIALIPLLVPPARPAWLSRRVLVPTATFAALVALSYLFYVHFHDWWYLRFFLPAYPLLFILLAAPVVAAVRAVPAAVSLPALVIAVALAIQYWIAFTVNLGTLTIGKGEDRYVAVAQYIERELPPNAVIFSMQHSGTIRFYSGRRTLRYDVIAPARFQWAIDWLVARNYRPYVLVEDWEEAVYRSHFAEESSALANLDLLILAELPRPVRIRLYDPLQPFNAARAPDLIRMPAERECRVPRSEWR